MKGQPKMDPLWIAFSVAIAVTVFFALLTADPGVASHWKNPL